MTWPPAIVAVAAMALCAWLMWLFGGYILLAIAVVLVSPFALVAAVLVGQLIVSVVLGVVLACVAGWRWMIGRKA